jgi:hypothetical protein
MTITVDLWIDNDYDRVSEHWRIEWHYGSNSASIFLMQPHMEWQSEVNISPFAPLAGAKQTLELMLRNHARELVA